MMIIGVTGGIGSGKSVVSEIFRLHGIPVFDADKEAKNLNDTSPYIKEQITFHFGEGFYKDGKLDREKFASIIFQDKDKTTLANSIIHPELAKHFIEWCGQRTSYQLVVIDAALLIEAGFHRFTDKVVMVSAPSEIRIGRVIKRDEIIRRQVKERMNKQLPEEEKIKYADFIIYNDNRHSLIRQIDDFLSSISLPFVKETNK